MSVLSGRGEACLQPSQHGGEQRSHGPVAVVAGHVRMQVQRDGNRQVCADHRAQPCQQLAALGG